SKLMAFPFRVELLLAYQPGPSTTTRNISLTHLLSTHTAGCPRTSLSASQTLTPHSLSVPVLASVARWLWASLELPLEGWFMDGTLRRFPQRVKGSYGIKVLRVVRVRSPSSDSLMDSPAERKVRS